MVVIDALPLRRFSVSAEIAAGKDGPAGQLSRSAARLSDVRVGDLVTIGYTQRSDGTEECREICILLRSGRKVLPPALLPPKP